MNMHACDPRGRFDSILVPLDGSPEAAKALGCAAWLAERLNATLHVLGPATPQIAAEQRARVVLHPSALEPDAAVRAAVQAQQVKLVVMTARGASASAGAEAGRRLGRVAEALMTQSAVPVLLLPVHYREALPWRSMLVAASGEAAADQALGTALRLAGALRLALSVLYCESPRTRRAALGAYVDAAHHECQNRLDLVTGAVSRRRGEDRGRIAQVLLCRGDPAAQVLDHLARERAAVVALGWHGSLDDGRALVLKRLLDEAQCPLLVVRQAPQTQARLAIGEEIDDLARDGR